jgi:hypothetical protein
MQKRREKYPATRALTDESGLLASGSSGDWSVDVDRTLGARPRYLMQLDSPRAYVHFQLLNRQIVATMHEYLLRAAKPAALNEDGSLLLGTCGQSQVLLIWDDEFRDRCFLIVGFGGKALVRITLLEDDVSALEDALGQALADLSADAT